MATKAKPVTDDDIIKKFNEMGLTEEQKRLFIHSKPSAIKWLIVNYVTPMDLYTVNVRPVLVIEIVASSFGISPKSVKKGNHQYDMMVRDTVMYELHHCFNYSFARIASIFGRKTPSAWFSAYEATRRTETRMKDDAMFREDIEVLTKKIRTL